MISTEWDYLRGYILKESVLFILTSVVFKIKIIFENGCYEIKSIYGTHDFSLDNDASFLTFSKHVLLRKCDCPEELLLLLLSGAFWELRKVKTADCRSWLLESICSSC